VPEKEKKRVLIKKDRKEEKNTKGGGEIRGRGSSLWGGKEGARIRQKNLEKRKTFGTGLKGEEKDSRCLKEENVHRVVGRIILCSRLKGNISPAGERKEPRGSSMKVAADD